MRSTSLSKRIRNGLWSCCALIVVMIGVMGLDAIYGRSKLDMVMADTRTQTLLHRLESDFQQLKVYELNFLVEIGNPSARSFALGHWASTYSDLQKTIAELRAQPGALAASTHSMLDDAASFSEQYKETFESITASAHKSSNITLTDLAIFESELSDAKVHAAKLVVQIETVITRAAAHNAIVERTLERELLFSLIMISALGITTVLIVLWLAVFVPSRLSSAIEALTGTIDEVSMGRRQSPIESSGVLEFNSIEQAVERLRISVNGMLQRLTPSR